MAGLYIGMEEDGRSTIAIILSLSLSLSVHYTEGEYRARK